MKIIRFRNKLLQDRGQMHFCVSIRQINQTLFMHNTQETDIGVKIIFSMHQLVWFMKLLSVISDRESWAGLGEPNLLRLINEDHAKLNLFSSLSVDKEPMVRNVKLQARRCRHRHSCGVQHYTQSFNVKHVKCDTSHKCSQLQYCSRFVSLDRMRGHSSTRL